MQPPQSISCFMILCFFAHDSNSIRLERHVDDYKACDDGIHGIEIDLKDQTNWKCDKETWQVDDNFDRHLPECYSSQRAYHVCIDKTIDNLYTSDIPHSGPHREVWARYGEYSYLPPGRYVHNLEHGGVVFMYHPCAPTKMVDKLRRVATTCLYRYILTSFGNLTQEYPFAVVTYGCIYRMSVVNSSLIKEWVRSMNGNSPEPDVYGNGKYMHGLLFPSVGPTEKNAFCLDSPGDDSPLPFQRSDIMADIISTSMPKNGFGTIQTYEKLMTKYSEQNGTFNILDIYANNSVDGFWLFSAVVFLAFGIFTCLCLIKTWMSPKQTGESPVRIWSNNAGDNTYSVAAIIRRLPSALNSETKKQFYHPIHTDDRSTEDEEI